MVLKSKDQVTTKWLFIGNRMGDEYRLRAECEALTFMEAIFEKKFKTIINGKSFFVVTLNVPYEDFDCKADNFGFLHRFDCSCDVLKYDKYLLSKEVLCKHFDIKEEFVSKNKIKLVFSV